MVRPLSLASCSGSAFCTMALGVSGARAQQHMAGIQARHALQRDRAFRRGVGGQLVAHGRIARQPAARHQHVHADPAF
jgi:hypothetical protein